ncbi:hypothetical protein [Thiogranum longum]
MSDTGMRRECDQLDVDIVLRLNAKGEAVRVEDRYGKPLEAADIQKEPIQGTVKALEPMVLITTQVNPTCTWVYIGGRYYRICK